MGDQYHSKSFHWVPQARTLELTTSGGSATTTLEDHGIALSIAIQPASDSTTYEFEFLDNESFGLLDRTGLTGSCTVSVRFKMRETTTFNITNASRNELFRVRIWFDE